MKRYVIIVVLLLAACAVSVNHLFLAGLREKPIDLTRLIPESMATWEGGELEIAEGTLRLLGTNNVLLRQYEDTSGRYDPVCLCLTFTWGNHRVTHPPEICYEGQGWEIQGKKEMTLTLQADPPVPHPVSRMRIFKRGEVHEVIVWYRSAGTDTASYLQQKFEMLLSKLFGTGRWTAMVRLSCRVNGEDRALESIAAFGGALLPHLDELARKVENE
jgi:EpsI family protein